MEDDDRSSDRTSKTDSLRSSTFSTDDDLDDLEEITLDEDENPFDSSRKVEKKKKKKNLSPSASTSSDVISDSTKQPLKEGFLTKCGAIRKSWKRRYFVLHPDRVLYYTVETSKPNTKLLGEIPLSNSEVLAAQEETKKKNCFKIFHPNRRTYFIYAANFDEMVSWMETISSAIEKLGQGKVKPSIGTPVEERDSSYQFMYELVLGIRHAVSRESGRINITEEAILSKSFKEKIKYEMRSSNSSTTTPSSKYDFEFTDYAPQTFSNLRERFGIHPADYLVSLTNEYMLSQLPTPGKSGSYFYFSIDQRFIIKTIGSSEFEVAWRMLPEYYMHVFENRSTLLTKLFGLHKISNGFKSYYVVVMGNVFTPYKQIHERYDLKGSTINRTSSIEERKKVDATLKDNDFNRVLFLGNEKRDLLLKQIESDVNFLLRMNVMDYSLLVGIHYFDKPSSVRSVWNKEGESNANTILTPPIETCLSVFTQDEGGFRSSTVENGPYKELYFVGIVDIFQEYTIKKQLEHSYKVKKYDTPDQISSVEPVLYSTRFKKFMATKVGWTDEFLNPDGTEKTSVFLEETTSEIKNVD